MNGHSPAKRSCYAGADDAALDEDTLTRLRRDKLGCVFQAFHVLPHLTLRQNVALPLWLQGIDDVRANPLAQQLLDAVGYPNGV